MKRTMLAFTLLVATAAALGAQETSRSNPYEGASNPPPDSTITVPEPATTPAAKPSPSHYAQPQSYAAPVPQPAPAPDAAETAPADTLSGAANTAAAAQVPAQADGSDDGIVQAAPAETAAEPALLQRSETTDPDGDIVHLAPLPQGELGVGVTIRVRLQDRLSTSESQPGETFHTRVASDVVQDGQVLIPAGSEIDGRVTEVSAGHAGGHGSMRLRPDTVILPNGSQYRLYAQLSGVPGSHNCVSYESLVTPGSRLAKAGMEYGGAAGAGAVTGAVLGGPGGALVGTIVGASLVSVHLLVSHPQVTLDEGSVLLFTLSEPLNLAPAAPSGN